MHATNDTTIRTTEELAAELRDPTPRTILLAPGEYELPKDATVPDGVVIHGAAR